MAFDPNYVMLVDRAGKGDINITYDGVYIHMKPGQVRRPVSQTLAEWLFRVDQHKVHTTDGEFVCRFTVEDAPEEFLARIGGQPDSSPITIDTTRVEGWDTERYAADRPNMRAVQLRRNPADYASDATPGGFGKAR